MNRFHNELEKLRHVLQGKGLPPVAVDNLTQQAEREINNKVADILDETHNHAVDVVSQIGDYELGARIVIKLVGSQYVVTTSDETTDFSLPALPMLPRLLKNAKMAKDGSLYKVIPIGKKSSSTTNLDQVHHQRNLNIQTARAERDVARQRQTPDDDTLRTMSLSGVQHSYNPVAKQRQARQVNDAAVSGPIEFRTASSKQNPQEKWVLPPKKLNIQMALHDLTNNLENTILQSVSNILQHYEGIQSWDS